MLDMDGIITNFAQGMIWHHKIEYPRPWPKGVGDLCEVFGMTFNQLWKSIDQTFWRNLPWMNDTWQIMVLLKRYGYTKDNTYIVTSLPSIHGGNVSQDVDCAAGKVLWMHDHWEEMANHLVICVDKNFAADTKEHILIDDSDSNVAAFKDHGGHAILLPRPWNSLYGEQTLPYLERSLECLDCA